MRTLYASLFLLSLGLSACSSFDRSDSSGYANGDQGPSTVQQYYSERRGQAWKSAKEELGIIPGKELSEQEATAVQNRVELSRLEKGLTNDAERKQYYTMKPFFKGDPERIYFLKLPNRESRARWANSKGIVIDDSKFDSAITSLIEKNDIAKGMTKGAVQQSWGEPDFVEVAGNPLYGNERWRYNKQVSTDEGYKNETRIIYFESGRVVGWETL